LRGGQESAAGGKLDTKVGGLELKGGIRERTEREPGYSGPLDHVKEEKETE